MHFSLLTIIFQVGTINILNLEMKKLRLTKVEWLMLHSTAID